MISTAKEAATQPLPQDLPSTPGRIEPGRPFPITIPPMIPRSELPSDQAVVDIRAHKIEKVADTGAGICINLSYENDKAMLEAWPECPACDSEPYSKLLPIIASLCEQKKHEQAQRLCNNLLDKIVNDSDRLPGVAHYLQKISLLCALNTMHPETWAPLEVLARLSANSCEDFIQWLLLIAKSAACGTVTLAQSKRVELSCYRQAADAGSQEARLLLVKQLLLSGPEKSPPFLLDEARRLLSAMANSDTSKLPEPTDEQEKVLLKLVRALEHKPSYDRKALASELISSKSTDIQPLAPMLYLCPEFGEVNASAAKVIITQVQASLQEKTREETKVASMVCDFWVAECARESSSQRYLRLLKKLSDSGFPSAQQRLLEYHLQNSSSRTVMNLSGTILLHVNEWFYLCPDLNYVLYTIGETASKDKLSVSARASQEHQFDLLKLKQSRLWSIMLKAASDHCHTDARFSYLYKELSPCTDEITRPRSASATLKIPEAVSVSLKAGKYSQDPQVLVLQHFVEMLCRGEADDTLIDNAMTQDKFTTLYRMVLLKSCTSKLMPVPIMKMLLETAKSHPEALERWFLSPEIETLKSQIFTVSNRLGQEEALIFILELAKSSVLVNPHHYIYLLLGDYLLTKGDTAAAKLYFTKYNECEKKGSEKVDIPKRLLEHRRIYVPLPDTFRRFNEFGRKTTLPAEAQYTFRELLSLRNAITGDKNPVLLNRWINDAIFFIHLSAHGISYNQFSTLVGQIKVDTRLFQQLDKQLIEQTLLIVRQEISFLEKSTTSKQEEASSIYNPLRWFNGGPDREPGKSDPFHFKMARSFEHFSTRHRISHELETCQTPEKAIEVLSGALTRPYLDPVELAIRMPRQLKGCPKSHFRQAKEVLNHLDRKLELEIAISNKEAKKTLTYLITAMESYALTHPDRSKELSEDIERIYISQVLASPMTISHEMQHGAFSPEASFFKSLSTQFSSLDEKLNYITQYLKYNPYAVSQWLIAIKSAGINKEEEASITQFCESVGKNQISFSTFIKLYLLDGDYLPILQQYVKQKKRSVEDKFVLISQAIVMNAVKKTEALTLVNLLPGKSVEKSTLLIMLADTQVEFDQYFLQAQASLDENQLKHSPCRYYGAAGWTCLQLGNPVKAFELITKDHSYPKSAHIKSASAILSWVHHGSQDTLVQEGLRDAAKEYHIQSQCRLLDWLLAHEPAQEATKLMKLQCYRFLMSPSIFDCKERLLYQGVLLYTGTGCQVDQEAGLAKVREALLHTVSSIPAIRLVYLQDNGHLPGSIVTGINLFEQIAIHMDNLTRDQATELFMSLPAEFIDKLTSRLRSFTDENPSIANKYQAAANTLENIRKGLGYQTIKSEQDKEITLLEQSIIASSTEKTDTQSLPERLAKLKKMQGAQFPAFKDDDLLLIVSSMPLDSKSHSDLAMELYNAFSTEQQKVACTLRLADLYFPAQESLSQRTWVISTLCQMIPSQITVSSENTGSLLRLISLYPDQGIVPGAWLSCLDAPGPDMKVWERFLLEHDYITPSRNPKLYSCYFQRAEKPAVECAERVFDALPLLDIQLFAQALQATKEDSTSRNFFF